MKKSFFFFSADETLLFSPRFCFLPSLFPFFLNKPEHLFPKDTGNEFPVRER